MEYVHSTNTHIRVRIISRKQHSPNPYQHKPYVVHMKDGKKLDKRGEILADSADVETHIPLDEFIYKD